jgi:hypothetical protein
MILIVFLMACKGETQLSQLFHHGGDPFPPDPAPQASDLNADQLLAKHAAARGGEQKLQAIKSVKMAGTWEANTAVPITVNIAPGRYSRRIAEGSQVTMWNVVDGQTHWEVNPRNGITKPKPMSDKDAARFRRLASPAGPLVGAKAKGNKVEVVGKQPLKGAQVYKLKLTTPDGTVSYFYIDAKTFLLRRVLNTQYVPQLDKNIETEILYSDYRDVDGVKFPFKEEANAPEANFSQTITWDKVELNQPVDEAAFKAPQG